MNTHQYEDINQTKELSNDLYHLFEIEDFYTTLDILKNKLSSNYVKDVSNFLDAIINFQIHKVQSEEPYKYVQALKRKLSIGDNEKFYAQKVQLFVDISQTLLQFVRETTYEKVNIDGTFYLELKNMSISDYLKCGLILFKPCTNIPSLLQINYAIDTLETIEADSIILQIATLKEKISLLTKYLYEIAKDISILTTQIDLKNPRERQQLDKLKTEERSRLVELSTAIGTLSSMYSQIQANATTEQDYEIIKELFSMEVHINMPLLDSTFSKIVESIINQIIQQPTNINVGQTIQGLINDADLAQYKKIILSSELMQITQVLGLVIGNFIDTFSDLIPNKKFNRDPNIEASKINAQSRFTKTYLSIETIISIINLYNSTNIFLLKKHQIEQQIAKMHKEIIEQVFKFLGKQVEIDAEIQSIHSSYEGVLQSTALNQQGIKSDSENNELRYDFYAKILKFYNCKMELITLYSSIRSTYNLLAQLVMSSFKENKLTINIESPKKIN